MKKNFSRRDFLRSSCKVLAAGALLPLSSLAEASAQGESKEKVDWNQSYLLRAKHSS